MAKDFSFQFKPGDYLRDTQTLSESAQVAYDRIMCEHIRETFEDMMNICVSYESVKFVTKKLTDEDRFLLTRTLTDTGKGFQISWVAESIAQRRGYIESRRANRKKTKVDTEIISKTYDSTHVNHMTPHMDNDNDIDNDNSSSSSARGVTDWILFDPEFCAGIRSRHAINQEDFDHMLEQFDLDKQQKSVVYNTTKEVKAGFLKWVNTWIRNEKTRGNGVTKFNSADRNPANRKSKPNQILTDGEEALLDAVLSRKVEMQ